MSNLWNPNRIMSVRPNLCRPKNIKKKKWTIVKIDLSSSSDYTKFMAI